MYPFLSDEWIAAAHQIRERYADDIPPLELEVAINQVVTDVPFGEGTLHTYIDTSAGTMDLRVGELDDPDVTIVTDYATARAMIVERDPAALMQAFLEGRIQVQGDMMKLMALQAAAPSQGVAERVAEEIRAITAG